MSILDAVVIGAGPAGLATSRELGRRGLSHVVVERSGEVGHSWASFYDSLTLHTGRHMSSLPGLPFPRGTPLFVPRDRFVAYLREYARRFALPVRLRTRAVRVVRVVPVARRESGAVATWRVECEDDRGAPAPSLEARAVVVATGIASNPRRPALAGEERFAGRVLHSADYRRPDGFVGARVLIVGIGNSGGEIASELARAGATVSVSVRSGANVVPRTIAGIPIQYVAYGLRALPRAARERLVGLVGRLIDWRRGPAVLPRPDHSPLDAIPLIGFHLVDAIRAGQVAVRPELDCLTTTGARFVDGREEPYDAVLLATGFAPALDPLAGLVRTDPRGFALRADHVTSADQPQLFFVGHNYDATGALANISRDAAIVATAIKALPGREGEPRREVRALYRDVGSN